MHHVTRIKLDFRHLEAALATGDRQAIADALKGAKDTAKRYAIALDLIMDTITQTSEED